MTEPADRSLPAVRDAAVDQLDGLTSTRLLGFYDRLRERITGAAAGRGKIGRATVETLLLVPDVFILLARLALDREVPPRSRRLIGGALLYFVLPIDLFPEAFAGVGGFVDDLLIACAVLTEAFGDDLDTYARRYWNGSTELATVLRDVSRTSDSLLRADLHGRVRKFLGRRGVRLESDQPRETLARQ